MSLIKKAPTSPQGEVISDITPVSPAVSVNYVDSKMPYNRQNVTFVEGYSWIGTYYKQVLGANDAPKSQDYEQSGVYQQYIEVKGLEFKVSQTLQSTQDQQTGSFTVTGSANLYAITSIKPNKGDMWCADIGDGREGVFTLTQVEKKSIFSNSVYAVDYTLVYLSGDYPAKRADLKTKTIKSLNFVKSLFYSGQDPLVIDDEYESFRRLSYVYKEIIDHYFTMFFSDTHKTFVVPNQSVSVYDPFVVNFMSRIMRATDHYKYQNVKIFDTGFDKYLEQEQIYSVIFKNNDKLLRISNTQMGVAKTRMFLNPSFFKGIAASSIAMIVYPMEPTDMVGDKSPIPCVAYEIDPSPVGRTVSDFNPNTSTNALGVRWIYPVNNKVSYVFSEQFYSNDAGQSVLELLVRQYFRSETITSQSLMSLLEYYPYWGSLEQFYYLPICLALIKSINPEV